MQSGTQGDGKRSPARRALACALLLAGLLTNVACGVSPSPTATVGPTPSVVSSTVVASRTTCVGAGCPGIAPTTTIAALTTPTAVPTATAPAPTPTIAATPTNAVLYRADFRTWFLGEEGGQYPLRASIDPGTGEYRLALTGPEGGYANYRTIPGGEMFADFQLDIDLRKVAGPDRGFYGVVFRVQSAVPGARTIERYLLAISGDGFLTFNYIAADGTVTRVAPRAELPSIARGDAPNHLTLVCRGTDFTLSVNGQLVGTYAGPINVAGSIGVTVGTVPSSSPSNSIEVAFSNLVISRNP